MMETIYAVIDNQNNKKGNRYKILYKSRNIKTLFSYAKEKGLL